VGYHVAWNYFEGHVLGFPVSGTQVHGVYTVASSHNEFLAGGAYGPEGGFMVTLVLLAGFCLVWRSAGLCQVASRDPSAGNVNRM